MIPQVTLQRPYLLCYAGSMQDYMEMSLSDPRRIAPTIANVAPLPTSELVAAHRSCFQLMQSQNASSS